jgi:hypothetical protein
MAKDAANHLGDRLLGIDRKHQEYLAGIRHWSNLKMAVDGDRIWIKDFTDQQLHAAELKSIPYAGLFRVEDHLLFPEGSRLPIQKMPLLLWSPIEKALPISLPDLNHNYFGISERLLVKVIPSEQEHEPSALIVPIRILGGYLVQASAVRLQNLHWCILNKKDALILGQPLLPLSGTSFWQHKSFLMPTGFDLEFPGLTDTIEHKINRDKDQRIIWLEHEAYTAIAISEMKPLTLSSFRLTLEKRSHELV